MFSKLRTFTPRTSVKTGQTVAGNLDTLPVYLQTKPSLAMDTRSRELYEQRERLLPETSDREAAATRLMRTTRRPTVFTTAPELPPAPLICPICDVRLMYKTTVIGGVKPIERWHHFACKSCGSFVYRVRTQKLRRNT
jgi:hypothetical protein